VGRVKIPNHLWKAAISEMEMLKEGRLEMFAIDLAVVEGFFFLRFGATTKFVTL
jgi:hypothetical protein